MDVAALTDGFPRAILSALARAGDASRRSTSRCAIDVRFGESAGRKWSLHPWSWHLGPVRRPPAVAQPASNGTFYLREPICPPHRLPRAPSPHECRPLTCWETFRERGPISEMPRSSHDTVPSQGGRNDDDAPIVAAGPAGAASVTKGTYVGLSMAPGRPTP